MRDIEIFGNPYASICGTISVPDELTEPEAIGEYISDNWDEIRFGEPDLDFQGTRIEFDGFEYEF